MSLRLALTTLTRAADPGAAHGALWIGDFEGMTPILELREEAPGPGFRGLAAYGERLVVGVWNQVWLVEPDGRVALRLSCPALRDVHAIAVEGHRAWIVATGSDALISLDLRRAVFDWGLSLRDPVEVFDPRKESPPPSDQLHLNSVAVVEDGIVLSGLRTTDVFLLDPSGTLGVIDEVPLGTHDVRPHAGGLLFNDTARDRTIWRPASGPMVAVPVPRFSLKDLDGVHAADGGMARQAFARGLAVVDSDRVVVGSSPGTMSELSLSTGKLQRTLTFSADLRVAVHAIVCHIL